MLKPPQVLLYPPPLVEQVALLAATALAFLLIWAWRLTPRPATFPGRVAKALLAAVLAFALFEGALRVHEALPLARTLPANFWTLHPDLRGFAMTDAGGGVTMVNSNALGLRERDISAEKPPGTYRILCLGDSWTFGQGVADEETFARRLEALLGKRVQVINAGLPGFSYFQGYHLLRQLLPVYRPDLVLVCGFNQFGNRHIPEMEEALPRDPLAARILGALRRTRAYMLLRHEVQRLAPPSENRPPDPATADAAGIRYARGIANVAARGGARVAFFNHAFLTPHEPDPVLDALAADGLPTTRIHPVRSVGERPPFMLPADPTHPSARGHAAMARALAVWLRGLHLIQ